MILNLLMKLWVVIIQSKAMLDEMNFMISNEVWDLVPLSKGVKAIGNKWVFKTKRYSLGTVKDTRLDLLLKGSLNIKDWLRENF